MPLRRSSTDKMLGGVCGGVAQRHGFDPALLRVATVVAVFAGGLGLLGYAAAWLLIPADTDRTYSTLTRSLGRLIVGVLFALAAVAGLLGWLGSLGGLSGVIVGGFLVGVSGWLYLRRPTGGASSAPQGALAVSPPPLEQPQPTTAGFAYGGIGVTTPEVPWDPTVADQPRYYPAPPPRAPRERSYLGANVLLIAVIVMGLMGAGAAAGLFPLSPTVFFAVPLVVVAVGLIVGAFMGRARWLIFPAIILALITAVTVPAARFADTVNDGLGGGLGSPVWQPTSTSSYDLGVGSATLDLTTWANATVPQPTEASVVSASVQVGELMVMVPETWQVKVAADVNAGDLSINYELVGPGRPGVTADGDGARFDGVLPPVGDAEAAVTLDLAAGLGAISIVQVPLDQTPGDAVPSAVPAPITPTTPTAPTNPTAPTTPTAPITPTTSEDQS